MSRDPFEKPKRPVLGEKTGAIAKSSNRGFFVKGGVQISNLTEQKGVRYDEVKDTHYSTARLSEVQSEPEPKKSKLDEVHDEEYQKKLFTAAQSYQMKKQKQDLMDNIHKWNWKVRKGEKCASIKANDIKGFLYIWCNQRKVVPEWEYKERGKVKKVFTCELRIGGLDYLGLGEGSTKKEAQSNASWSLCNHCASLGLMNEHDFPKKEMVDTNAAGCIPTDWRSILTKEHIADAGGWNPETCQKRLQTFCNMEKVSCEIINSSMGPDHAKIQISELKITLKKYGKEFYAKEQARTKKCGNALVCWSIVKQLFKAQMIEKAGDKIRRPAEIKRGVGKVSQMQETVDEETGDWTLDTARQKLHEYLAKRQLTLEYEMSESGPPSDRLYIAEVSFEMDGKRYKAKDTAPNKKSAQKKVALDIIVRLYKEGKIAANVVTPGVYVDPRRPFISGLDPSAHKKEHVNYEKLSQRERDEKCCEMKLNTIIPDANFINAVNLFMDHIEKSLKEISDEYLKEEQEKDENKGQRDLEKLRKVCGIMKVGALAAQMHLRGENEFLSVLMMLDKPTYSDISRISNSLTTNFQKNYHENYKVTSVPDLGGIEITRNAIPKVTVMLSLSSIKSRPGPDGEVKLEPSDKIDMIPTEMCIRALADLRRAKWYNMHAKDVVNCLAVSRLIRDMSMRIPTWNVLSDWNIQLLVQKALGSNKKPLPKVSDALWRFFTIVAGGVILPGGEGVLDPCERDGVDNFRELSEQEREDVTTSAQHALRLCSFGQIHKILGMPPLKDAIKEAEIKAKKIAEGKV